MAICFSPSVEIHERPYLRQPESDGSQEFPRNALPSRSSYCAPQKSASRRGTVHIAQWIRRDRRIPIRLLAPLPPERAPEFLPYPCVLPRTSSEVSRKWPVHRNESAPHFDGR